ncbi:hypothetical protein KGF57_000088 [Candida theae]|uniref:Uncharacterized protein n=1 Tax=Candida theae TaxID=1198502 RepID=A0AAD5G112_9ASCO|nr:uncharacterized protein KGF57_000088 [Candida theae]KAI5968628.1 hypothetical protein KGF57_000088 [Candida theae]
MTDNLFKQPQLMMPYCESNRNSKSNTPPAHPKKQSAFGDHHSSTRDYYQQGSSPQNFCYSSFLPVFPIANGVVTNNVNYSGITARDKIHSQLKSPLQQVLEEDADGYESEGNKKQHQFAQAAAAAAAAPAPPFQQSYLHEPQTNQPEYQASVQAPRFELFGGNNYTGNDATAGNYNNNNNSIPRNLPCDAELEFARANASLNTNPSILRQLHVLPTPTAAVDVYDYLNPRKSANMHYKEKINSWLSSVPLAVAYDENLTQFNLNCYPGVVTISETATNSEVEIDLADIDDVLELQAQRVTRYVKRLYFNEEEIPLSMEEYGQDLDGQCIDEVEEQESQEQEEGEDVVAEQNLGEGGGMLGFEEHTSKQNPECPQRNQRQPLKSVIVTKQGITLKR